MDLNQLLLDVKGLSVDQLDGLGRKSYAELFLSSGRYGIHKLHDGEEVIFHEDRFDHAFFTSSDWKKDPNLKDVLALERVKRIRWIAPVIAGLVPDSACWDVPGPGGRIMKNNRLYVVYGPCYAVWLEPRNEAGKAPWRFSTAFDVNPRYIRDRTKLGSCLWRFGRQA